MDKNKGKVKLIDRLPDRSAKTEKKDDMIRLDDDMLEKVSGGAYESFKCPHCGHDVIGNPYGGLECGSCGAILNCKNKKGRGSGKRKLSKILSWGDHISTQMSMMRPRTAKTMPTGIWSAGFWVMGSSKREASGRTVPLTSSYYAFTKKPPVYSQLQFLQ